MRKFLSVFMAALMVVFSLPVVTFADDVIIFDEDATACEFILTPAENTVGPGGSVDYTLSVRPNGLIYGLEAHLILPEGFTLVKGSGALTDEGKELAQIWDDLAVTEINGTLLFTGFTALNPYNKNEVLPIATFSCNIAGDIQEDIYRVTLEDYYVLDSKMDPTAESTVVSHPVNVSDEGGAGDEDEEYEYDAYQVTFKLTADKEEAVPGDTVNFELSVIADGRIYGFQANWELPEGFTYIKGSGKLFDSTVEALKWGEFFSFNEVSSGLQVTGFTYSNPYSKARELKLAKFSCKIEEYAHTETVSLNKFTALDSSMDKIPDPEGIFPEITIVKPKYYIFIPENITVTRGDIELTDGDEIETGDILIITADEPENFVLKSLTVNERPFKSGGEFTVSRDNVEIKAVFAEIKNYRVYIPNNVTVTRDGVELYNNAEVTAGDELIIKANVPDGYRFGSFTINGERFTSAGITYKVIDDDVDIDVEFTEIEYYRVYIPNNVTVTRDGVELYNNAEVTAGDRLKITAKVPSGYRLGSLKVNDKAINNGSIYTVIDDDVDIEVEFTEIEYYRVYIPENVTVTHSGVKLDDGDEVNENDILIITANAPEGQALTSLTVNKKTFKSGDAFTVGTEDVLIEAEFTDIGNYTVKIPEYVTVTRSGKTLSNGAVITTGEVLTIRVSVPSGYRLGSLTVNNKAFTSGGTYKVTSEDVVIAVNLQKLVQYTVTVPSNVTVTRNGTALKNGSVVYTGDTLTITANPPSGYRLNSLTVNGRSISNGSRYTVGSANVTVAVSFSRISSGSSSGSSSSSSGSSSGYYIFIPENVEVRRNSRKVSDGDEINYRDKFTVEAKVPEGKKLVSLTVNDKEFKSGSVYTAGYEHIFIEVSFEDLETFTVTVPGGVSVTRGGNAVNNGDQVNEGDILVITANAPEGYKLTSLAVNGKEIANRGIYTTGNEDPVITVSFEKLPENKPAEPFIINDPEISGWEDISKTVSVASDKTVRIDMNGTTLLPGNVLQIIKNNGNKILLRMDEKVSWTIEGKDVTDTGRDVDLKVTLGTNNIPEDTVKRLAQNKDYLTLTLKHNGELGFKGLLVVELGTEYNTENAALYRYGDNAFTAEGRCDILHGKGVMEFTHASEWIVVFGNGEDDPNSNNSDTSNPGTSKPNVALPNENDKDDPNKNNSSTSTSTSNNGSKDKENPVTGGSRVSLTAFLALVASAAVALVTRKRKQ